MVFPVCHRCRTSKYPKCTRIEPARNDSDRLSVTTPLDLLRTSSAAVAVMKNGHTYSDAWAAPEHDTERAASTRHSGHLMGES
jgi:hypothetical protein